MILAVLALAVCVLVFFLSIYQSSRSSAWMALAWGLLGVTALSGIGATILQIMVPGFFGGGS
ncbi:MAG: hypothetical protein V1495_02260 [Pseudomonadota bacterium]